MGDGEFEKKQETTTVNECTLFNRPGISMKPFGVVGRLQYGLSEALDLLGVKQGGEQSPNKASSLNQWASAQRLASPVN